MAYGAIRYLAEASSIDLGTISTISRDPLVSAVFSLLLGPILFLYAWRSTVPLPGAVDPESHWVRGLIRSAVVAFLLLNLAVVVWFGVLFMQNPGNSEAAITLFAALLAPRLMLRFAWAALLVVGLAYLGKIYRLSGHGTHATISYLSAGSLILSLVCFLFTSLVDADHPRLITALAGATHRLSDADGLATVATAYLMLASDSTIKNLCTSDGAPRSSSKGKPGFKFANRAHDGQAPNSGS